MHAPAQAGTHLAALSIDVAAQIPGHGVIVRLLGTCLGYSLGVQSQPVRLTAPAKHCASAT